MLKPSITAGILLAAGSLAANALNVTDLKAGELSQRLTADDLTTTELTITGSMDASDFSFISDKLSELTSLDLSGVTVEAYSGEQLPYTSLTSAAANALPLYAFTGLTKLTAVALPQGITTISTGAFSGSGIKEVTIPASVTEIGDYAFMRCPNLQQVTIPSTVRSIGQRAFAYCEALSAVKFTDNASITALPEAIFEGCTSLTAVDLTALTQCTEIGAWSFTKCDGITSLTLPAALTTLGKGALLGDSAITELKVDDTALSTVGAYAMTGTSGITSLNLPQTLSSLGQEAMSDMTGLNVIFATSLTEVPAVDADVWKGVNQSDVTLVVSDELAPTIKAADQWKDFNVMSETEWEIATTLLPVADDHTSGIRCSVASGTLTITAVTPLSSVALFNAGGSRVAYADASTEQVTLNVSSLQSGVYLVVTNCGVAKIVI